MSNFFDAGQALLIGVGADLPNTINDAQGLAGILKDPARCGYRPEHVDLLAGEAADRTGVLASLDKLGKTADENSTVLIYFSGHGYHVKSLNVETYYLMPYGYNVNKLSDTAINGSEFIYKLKAIKAQKMLLLLDCCHAGGISPIKAPGLQLAKAPMPPEAQGLLAHGRGRAVIASSMANEVSFAGRPYSAFTLALIEALCGRGASQNDGFVRVADLALYTREMVSSRTRNMQHPILHYEMADNFVLAYYSGGEITTKDLPFTETPEIQMPGQVADRAITNLSREAQTLLKQTSESDGLILLPGWGIQIGRKQWMYHVLYPREIAALKDAIEELERLGFIRPEGPSREVFRITSKGYQVADKIESQGGI